MDSSSLQQDGSPEFPGLSKLVDATAETFLHEEQALKTSFEKSLMLSRRERKMANFKVGERQTFEFIDPVSGEPEEILDYIYVPVN